jgi:hypothetical protein
VQCNDIEIILLSVICEQHERSNDCRPEQCNDIAMMLVSVMLRPPERLIDFNSVQYCDNDMMLSFVKLQQKDKFIFCNLVQYLDIEMMLALVIEQQARSNDCKAFSITIENPFFSKLIKRSNLCIFEDTVRENVRTKYARSKII